MSTRSSDLGKTDKNCERDKARSAGDKMLSRDPVSLGSDLENLTRVQSALYCFYFIRKPTGWHRMPWCGVWVWQCVTLSAMSCLDTLRSTVRCIISSPHPVSPV